MLRHINPDYSAKKNASKGGAFSIRILASVISILFAFSAQAAFNTNSVINTIRASHEVKDHEVAKLYDGTNSYYYSGATSDWTEAAYLEIEVKDGILSENDADNCLVVMVTRHNQNSADLAAAHPTAFQVEGLFGDTWKQVFYTYFLYRGGLTTEFSERIPVANLWKEIEVDSDNGSMTQEKDTDRTGKVLSKLRFTVLSNNQNQAHEASGNNSYHSMALSAFDVVMLPLTAELPGGFSNRFHLSSDYLSDIHDFRFENTSGIFDPHNATAGWSFDSSDIQLLQTSDINITLPNYDLLDSSTSSYPLDPSQKRQPAHTVEHIMYAIPGDIVTLYPYYELYKYSKFQINYSHWYDYKTGGRLQYKPDWSSTSYDLLDFLADPSRIQVTDEHGFFGGQNLNVETHVVKTVDDWIKLANEMNATKTATQLKDEPVCYYIELDADLDFEGRDGVAMMGNTTDRPFAYHLNGKGHTIKNLNISYPGDGGVGIIRYSADGAIIENLNIDSSCTIVGSHQVGLVGVHRGGRLTFRNVHTEATVYGKNQGSEQAAGGLLGFGSIVNNNVLVIEDCYVGGKVGNPDTNIANSNNAALVAWWETNNNTAPVTLRNVIVDCTLTGYETANKYKRYIRHRRNTEAITKDPDGTKTKAIFTFQNCYGNIDPDDQCWQTTTQTVQVPNEKISNLLQAGWVDAQTPPMESNIEVDLEKYPYTRHYSAGNAKQYIEAVNAINNRTDRSVKVYFYLTGDIDFTGYAEDEVPMLGDKSGTAFNGFLNGQGHTIKNLRMKRTGDDNYVGIVKYASDGIRIENLILDESCYFEGPQYVSLVGTHLGGSMKVSNYKTEATFIGTHPTKEQCAAGILGINKEETTDNVINFSDIYIGGKIGNPDAASHPNPYNSALVGWLENKQLDALSMSKSHLYRIVVKCELNHPENTDCKKYIRHRKEKAQLSENKENHIITKANFEFDACYGRIDLTDKCWREDENETILQREGWADNDNPPMESVTKDSSIESGYTVLEVSSVDEYKDAVNNLGNSESTADICISLRADLNFDGVTDVPLIGESQAKAFRGFINGNGHTIKNLTVKRTGSEAGLICWAGDGVRIENLIIDSSCLFEANTHAGLVGRLVGGTINVKNIKTEATARGTANGIEHAAGGILGFCDNQGTDNVFNLENIYIGGVVGNATTGTNNGAICGWFENRKFPDTYNSMSTIKNVVIKCDLNHADGTWKKYIRHKLVDADFIQSDSEGYSVKANFRFKNCYGNLDSNDKAWPTAEPTTVLGWNNMEVPMVKNMNVNLTEYPYTRHYSACDAAQYIEMVMAINSLSDRNVYFELTNDIDFSGYPTLPMLGESKDNAFSGFLNGNGHTIKNMAIIRTTDNVGIIGNADDGVRMENIIVDKSCHIEGRENIGLIGYHKGGKMIFRNIKTEATVFGTNVNDEQAAGGILGKSDNKSADNVMDLENVYVGGVVGNKDAVASTKYNNGAVAGWFENRNYPTNPKSTSTLHNVVANCNLYYPEDTKDTKKFIRHYKHDNNLVVENEDGSYTKANFKFINCFGSPEIDDKDVCWLPLTVKSELNEFPTLEGWNNNTTPGVNESTNLEKLQNNIGDRSPGTSATFLFPWCPYLDKKEQTELKFQGNDDEYVIAADFSQRFDIDNNLDKEGKVLYEPIISVRHIFRIRDGRAFADQLSGSVESNKEYLRKNLKIVSARGGVPFQIRLTTPVPDTNEKNGRCNYYYKLDEGMYSHVARMGIRVLDGETRTEITNPGFGFSEKFAGVGTRTINGSTYATGDGSKNFYRMLAFQTPQPNTHYIVQLIARDDAGNDINIYNTTNEKLVVMEYDITFLPERGASLLTEEKLYDDDNFKHARIEYLDENYGGTNKEPSTFIDFDEYIKINTLSNEVLKNKFVEIKSVTSTGMQHSYFKWPLEWSLSEYSFGYDDRQDYNMYMLATHSENVPYKDASSEWSNNVEGDGNGLYDRLYYRTKRMIEKGTAAPGTEMQQGYYYYVNASTDPGVTARLRINSLCQGSTIHVSAWISEFSKATETANLSFNFVAVLKDDIETEHPSLGLGNGERIVLHQFITGYVPNDQRGRWLNIYYSFVPRLSDFASETLNATMVDHYEIELDNNAKNSSGADYAIDDIRAYVVPPTIEAKQLAPMCSDKELRIRVASPFDTLLELAGESEAATIDGAKQISLYYTFIDKEEFDKQIAEVSDADLDTKYPEIFSNNLVQPMPDNDYNTIVFWSNYQKNTKYEYTNGYVASESAYRLRDEVTGERYIVFENLVNESINSGLLNPGREYYLVLNTGYENDTPATKGIAEFFDLVSECASKCVMVITPSSIVKVNGIVETQKDKMVICENTSPVIQANVTGFNQSGDQFDVKKNAVFDWFLGTNKEFNEYKDNEGNLLASALQTIRARYPDDDINSIEADEASRGNETISQWMIDIVKRASSEIDEEYGCARLILHQRSFIMPPISIPEGEKEMDVTITAIPIPIAAEDMPENVLVCTDPSELTITIGHKAPLMRHGFKDIPYPENLVDVPLRIGLEQIRKNDEMQLIEVPVKTAISPNDDNVVALEKVTEQRTVNEETKDVAGCIVLVETNDPEYKKIIDDENDEEGEIEFPWVGEIKSMTAKIDAEKGNNFVMQFANDFDVKEGYYYKLRFDYEERLADDMKSDAICNGQDLLTLKIVPKFQVWNGSENLNWSNDANWSRLDAAEIHSAKKDGDHKHFVTDGVNTHVGSYAPLDFTYVVIKNGMETPYLYVPSASDVKDVKDDYNNSYSWPANTSPVNSNYNDYPETLGEATPWIEYDMAAKTLAQAVDDVDIRCRPWYMNTCNEIHFKPGGTIMNQQLLTYEKAWVDVELDHSRWQTLSTPLKEVYAGDFYLPSDNARQETELFQPITFDNNLANNHRFKPAVYQRGWDKATANVYELENQSFDSPRNVAVKTFWSHVYNDVTVEYGKGNGFSIKTDVSEMGDEISEKSDYKVLFRLPKADDKYLYYTQDGTQSGHETKMTRTPGVSYRLNDTHGTITAVSAEKCSYFLVGNPFMTHMDIRKFISENNKDLDVLAPEFWYVTADGQVAGTINGDVVTAADPSADAGLYDPTVIAPMQGFFVKAKTATNKLDLKYNESMIRRYDSRNGNYLTSTTRAEEPAGMLKIVAQCDGFPATAALLATDTIGRSWIDVEAIDNRGLDVPATVYTAKNGKALSINCCADAEGTEIGVIADDETETILRFTGVEAVEGLCLLDKADHSLIPLEEGMEISVNGAAAGRYFLTYGIAGDGVMSGIEWSVSDGVLTAVDNAASGYMEVNVFDTVGRQLNHAATDDAEISVPIEKGIYVVEIKTAKERISIKVRI